MIQDQALIEEDIESSESSGEEKKETPNEAHLTVGANTPVKPNSLQLSMRMSTTVQVFEKFEGINIHKQTF